MPNVRATRLSLSTIEAHIAIVNVAAIGPDPVRLGQELPDATRRRVLVRQVDVGVGRRRRRPPLRPGTLQGNQLPAACATWPMRAKTPAPIMTPVPIETAPVSVIRPLPVPEAASEPLTDRAPASAGAVRRTGGSGAAGAWGRPARFPAPDPEGSSEPSARLSPR